MSLCVTAMARLVESSQPFFLKSDNVAVPMETDYRIRLVMICLHYNGPDKRKEKQDPRVRSQEKQFC